MSQPLIERFRSVLPVGDATPVISLGEGSTPLLRAPRLSERYGVELWLKWEGANPTGSYKDRGMTVAVSKAVEEGAEAVICASTGNTAASAAAYAARAGLPALVLVPEGAVAGAKLAQTRMLGARVLEVRGSFDEALGAARALAERGSHVLVNSLNPYRIAGQKTAPLEIVEELGGAPDAFVLPYGGGGNTTAYAAALAELEVAAAIVSAEAENRPATLASAIRIAEPVHAPRVGETGARVVSVSDEEIVDAWRELAASEGVFCEPSSAAGLAAVARGGCGRASRRDADRPWPEGRHGRRPLRACSRARRPGSGRDRGGGAVIVRAPATSANLGAGFDCAGVALDLWNELELTEGEGVVGRGRGRGRAAGGRVQPRRARVRARRRPGWEALPLPEPRSRSRAASAPVPPRSRSGCGQPRPQRRTRSCSRSASRSSRTPTTSPPRSREE